MVNLNPATISASAALANSLKSLQATNDASNGIYSNSTNSALGTTGVQNFINSLSNENNGTSSLLATAALSRLNNGTGASTSVSQPGINLSSSGNSSLNPTSSGSLTIPKNLSGNQVVSAAQKWIGTPYQWGGTSLQGVDCSGLVQNVYKSLGIALPRTSQLQATVGREVAPTGATAGDLVTFDVPGEGANSHVGIYLGNGTMIDAPHTGSSVGVHSIQGYGTPHFHQIIGG